jgi:tetratricopeptide (TPR) repeat protein
MSPNPTKPGQTPSQKKRPSQKSSDRRRHQDEPQMFFERLRSKGLQRSVYVILIVVFAGGFVIGGVGSGGGLSLGDLFGNNGGGSTVDTSLKSLQEKVKQQPNNAAAWEQLGLAEQSDNPTQAAKDLKKAVALAPKRVSARQALATLYQTQGTTLQSNAQNLQSEAFQLLQSGPQSSPFNRTFTGALTGVGSLPIDQAEQAQLSDQAQKLQTQSTTLQSQATGFLNNAIAQWKVLTQQRPNDAGIWLQYGTAANAISDKATTTKALKKFLALAPDDPQAPQVKAFLKQLNPPPTTSSGTGTGATGTGG